MGWRHPADDLPAAHAHQPRTVFLPLAADDQRGERDGAGGETDRRHRESAAVRAGCSCGWRGPRLAITLQGRDHRGDDIDREVETLRRRRLQGHWEAHLREQVPTLALHLHMPHVRYLDTELAGAVGHARRQEASWAAIADACSPPGAREVMSRQAAQQRWGRSATAGEVAGRRAGMPVVTGWPGLADWAHPAARLDPTATHHHQPHTVWVQRSGGESDRCTRTSTALRPACRCGWRGGPRPVPDEPPARRAGAVAGIERGFGPEWGRHLYTAVPTLRVREVLDLMAGVHPDLDAAVAHARHAGASWQDIATVVGTRRQSAHQRWRRLDTRTPADDADAAPPAAAGESPPERVDDAADRGAGARRACTSRVRKAPPLLRPAPPRPPEPPAPVTGR